MSHEFVNRIAFKFLSKKFKNKPFKTEFMGKVEDWYYFLGNLIDRSRYSGMGTFFRINIKGKVEEYFYPYEVSCIEGKIIKTYKNLKVLKEEIQRQNKMFLKDIDKRSFEIGVWGRWTKQVMK